MLAMSRTPINSVISYFADRGLEVAFLVPTPNGYKKSIMDAIASVRDFLKINKIHDYEKQNQGTRFKVLFPTVYVDVHALRETQTSLYRPETKEGDPRIWFHDLKSFCEPCDLLAMATDGKVLYVLNLSNRETLESLSKNSGIPADTLNRLQANDESVANELLDKFNELHRRGFVRSVTSGDTGVGMTAEYYLGIPPNALKTPDYKGIEIKCSRKTQRTPNRVNLYSQVPDWKNSRGMTAEKLLLTYGYWTDSEEGRRFNLYCTVEAHRPNTQSLFFEVDDKQDLLVNYSQFEQQKIYVVQWSLQTLRERLLEKHKETFWVKAQSRFEGDIEYFQYDSVVHTKKPTASLLGYLIDAGIITMDYTMHFKPNGKVRDHGYLFKIKPDNVGMLFPDPIIHELK